MADTQRDDLAWLLRTERLRSDTSDSHARAITREQVTNVADLFAMYPQMGPVAISLGLAGVPPNSSLAVQAGVMSARQQAKMLPNPGTVVNAGMLKSFAIDAGKALDAAMGGVNKAVDATGPVGQVIKDTVRQQFTAASYPIEGIKAFGNTTAGAWMEGWNGWNGDFDFAAANDYLKEHGSLGDINERTTLGAGLAEMVDAGITSKESGDVFGDGWFVGDDTPAGQRRVKEARELGLIDGHAITLGRATASSVFEPGSLAFNLVSGTVDASTYFADPTAIGGNAIRSASVAKKVIGAGPTKKVLLDEDVARAAGLAEGNRQVVLPEKFEAWLGSEAGNSTAQGFADIRRSDPEGFNKIVRATQGKLAVRHVLGLLDAEDSVAVKGVLIQGAREGAIRGTMTAEVKKPPPRLLTNLPGSGIRRSDPEEAVRFIDRWQRTVQHLGTVDEATISKNNENVARALMDTENPQRVFDTTMAVFKVVEHALVGHGVSVEHARRVTRSFGTDMESLHAFARDDVGRALEFPGVMRGVHGEPLSTPHLLVEMLDDFIPLPHVRDLKTAARRYKAMRVIEESGVHKWAESFLDWFTQDLFKTAALALRPAWMVRVVGEETLGRMTAAGLASPLSHPIHYLSFAAGIKPDTKISKAIEAAGIKGSLGHDVLGRAVMQHAVEESYQTNFGKSLNKRSGGWHDDSARSLSGRWIDYDKRTATGTLNENFAHAWHLELTKLHAEPMTRWMADGAPLVQVQKAFWSGEMSKFRQMMVNGGNEALTSRSNSDAFVKSEFARLMLATSGDTELLAAVAKNSLGPHGTEKLGGMVGGKGRELTDGVKINPQVTKRLKAILEKNPNLGPDYLTGPITDEISRVRGVRPFTEGTNAAAEWLFRLFGSLPTNRWARSITHQQFYWQRIEEMLPMMTAKSREMALRNAAKTRVPKKRLDKMRASIVDSPPGELKLADADWAAGHYAQQEVKTLLYDLHEKGQWADAMRVALPFGEAFKEVIVTWGRLIGNRPSIPYRAMQGVDKLDDDGSGVIYDLTGTPHPQEPGNRGFFFTDEFGEERFAYPGSQLLTGLAGDPGGFTAPVQGLNMFGTLAPGVGPAVSMPFAKMAPQTEDWDWIRGKVLPYGDPDTGSGLLETILPAYMRKLQVVIGFHPSAAQQRAFANTTHDVAAYLSTTGDYDLQNPEEQDRLWQDAKKRARTLFLVRALSQSTLPAAPSPQAMAYDKSGDLTFQVLMARDYQKMMADPKIGPQGADTAFIEKWGERALLATTGNTFSDGASPPTEKAWALRQEHPEVARKFHATFGLFVPDLDNYSTREAVAQIQAGTRVQNEAIQWQAAVNERAARAKYEAARAKLPKNMTPNQSILMAKLKVALQDEYPGFDGEFSGSATAGRVAELRRAAKNPVLAATDAGQGLTQYLKVRAAADGLAERDHLGDWRDTKRGARVRELVRLGAQAVIEEHPDFALMWERVLRNEVGFD